MLRLKYNGTCADLWLHTLNSPESIVLQTRARFAPYRRSRYTINTHYRSPVPFAQSIKNLTKSFQAINSQKMERKKEKKEGSVWQNILKKQKGFSFYLISKLFLGVSLEVNTLHEISDTLFVQRQLFLTLLSVHLYSAFEFSHKVAGWQRSLLTTDRPHWDLSSACIHPCSLEDGMHRDAH